jgi:hypothetical protein
MQNARKISGQMVRRSSKEEIIFDRNFWRKAGHEARFAAAWEMTQEVSAIRGQSDECQPGLQRSVQNIQLRSR